MIYTITEENGIFVKKGHEILAEAIRYVNEKNGGTVKLEPAGGRIAVCAPAGSMESALPALRSPVRLEGNGCILQGAGTGTGLILQSSGCSIKDLTIAGYANGLWICPKEGSPVENTRITDCTFQDILLTGLLTGSDEDDTGIKGLTVEGCRFTTNPSGRDQSVTMSGLRFAAIIAAALSLGKPGMIRNAVLKDVKISRCSVEGTQEEFGEGMFFLCGYDYSYAVVEMEKMMTMERSTIQHAVMENIRVENSRFSGVFDGSLFALITSSGIHSEGCRGENIHLTGNRIVFGLAGMGINGLDLYGFGKAGCRAENNRIYNCVIEKNELTAADSWKGEDIGAIGIETALHENGICTSQKCSMENIVIRENIIHGGEFGIRMTAVRAFADETPQSCAQQNSLKSVDIIGNRFENQETAITIYGARLDGRYDFPPMHEGEMPKKKGEYGMTAHDNAMEDVRVEKNRCIGTKLFLQAAGARVSGHGLAEDNRVVNVRCAGNVLEKGRLTFFQRTFVSDQFLYEEAAGKGNRAADVVWAEANPQEVR